ncbi:hypothetical protein COCOBI_11-2300 [Coccomyxa sp. Obi]|nr:hypothetical protein COCOBI_11-2300 [Coccomyxa sp. Obi]
MFASCSPRCHPQHYAKWPRCRPHILLNTRNRRLGRVFAAQYENDILSKAVQFYEEAWGGDMQLLESLVAEDHIQRDMVWQDTPGVGREKLLGGIQRFRSIYPDIAFRVLDASASPTNDKVFVHWTMTGTFEGERASSSGISLLRFEDGRIAETSVYRQALPAEVILAQRSKRVEPVAQGILLGKRTTEVPENP